MTPTLVIMAHRNVSIPTFISTLRSGYNVEVRPGDALIDRARSIAASEWMRNVPDSDVMIMADDDFWFTREGLDALVEVCRDVKGIVAGVTPLRSGSRTAIVALNGGVEERWKSEQAPAEEVRWAGGLLAFHRIVFEKMKIVLPLLHKNDVIPSFWPFFLPMIYEHEHDGPIELSEDYACCERARACGFEVWVEPRCQVGHLASVIVTAKEMKRVFEIHQPMLGGK